MTATILDVHNNVSETIYITANIGPGPNSTAFLTAEGAILYPQERNALRQLLRDEDDLTLQHVARWLQMTSGITLTLSGAHHEIECFEATDGNQQSTHACLFCGERYRWAIRCPGNPEGLI